MKRLAFLLVLATVLCVGQAGADPVSDWNALAGLFDMPYLHIVIYDAVNAIDGRYSVYAIAPLSAVPWASKEAAVAAAGHRVLLTFYPGRQQLLDSVYAAALALLPNDSTRTRGIAIGEEVAQGFLALRVGDGRFANVPYTFLPPGPGTYQLTPGWAPPPPPPRRPGLG
jgi:hypothetical protein